MEQYKNQIGFFLSALSSVALFLDLLGSVNELYLSHKTTFLRALAKQIEDLL